MAIFITNTLEDFDDIRNLDGDSLFRQIINDVSDAGLEKEFFSFIQELLGENPVSEILLHDLIRYDEIVHEWLNEHNVEGY